MIAPGPIVASEAQSIQIRLIAWRVLGTASVSIGLVNAFIPLMPTTVFLLVGALAWSKGAPEWHARLLAHRRWGPPLRNWADGRRVSRRGKLLATAGISAGWLAALWFLGGSSATFMVGAGLAALVGWLWSRPEPRA
jgi:uncharacterized membrane protein YbaN (DUF454 family)